MMKQIRSFFYWLNERLERVADYDRNIKSWLIGFALVTSLSATIYALGNPMKDIFFDHLLNIGKYIFINLVLFGAITYVLAAFFSIVYLRVPRIALASFVYTVAVNTTILSLESSGTFFSYTIGLAYSMVCAGVIGLAILFFKYKRRIEVTIIVALLLTGFFLGTRFLEPKDWSGELTSTVPGVFFENPAEKGSYDYTFYTYGSGKDLHRDWFGDRVDELTQSVDSSHFITKWGKERTKFWGFTEANLPINGRLWLPEGEGPFPLVLMVHGNHTMEYMSTSGYDYLGEQLASRGFIAISVDEDFINYSNTFGSPNRNYELRAWIMMQHLRELQRMNAREDSLLFGKVDFDQVGLMGHSRGGQAVAMVADYERFFSDAEDEDLLDSMRRVSIKGIVAIAPTDRSINNEKPYLKDLSYLLLHGARDADVNDFSNEKQFYRTSFSPGVDHFKASVYVEKANHTQFNSDWGRMDLSLPRGLFLNRKHMLKPKEQQVVAKLYMSAFFERVFNKDTTYDFLFENPYYARDFLPETILVTKYNPASYRVIESFSEESSYEGAVGFSELKRVTPEHRRGSNRQRDALFLKWSGSASLSLDISKNNLQNYNRIVLTMANADEEAKELPLVTAEFVRANGERERLVINDELPLPPVIKTQFTHYGLFDQFFRGDRYKDSWEPVFQTFPITLEQLETVEEIILHFSAKEGSLMIQEVGVY